MQRELGLQAADGPQVVFGIYDFESLRVQSSPALTPETPRLRSAPRSAEELTKYATEVVEALMSLEEGEREAGYMLTMRA